MALHKLPRALAACAVLFFFAFGLFFLKRVGMAAHSLSLGIGSLALAAGMAAGLIYSNYKTRVIGPSCEPRP